MPFPLYVSLVSVVPLGELVARVELSDGGAVLVVLRDGVFAGELAGRPVRLTLTTAAPAEGMLRGAAESPPPAPARTSVDVGVLSGRGVEVPADGRLYLELLWLAPCDGEPAAAAEGPRFGSLEHTLCALRVGQAADGSELQIAGIRAGVSAKTIFLVGGKPLTFGDITALGGDFYAHLDDEARQSFGWAWPPPAEGVQGWLMGDYRATTLAGDDAASVEVIRQHILAEGSGLFGAIKNLVDDVAGKYPTRRYLALASLNPCHFACQAGGVYGDEGNEALALYRAYHRRALDEAAAARKDKDRDRLKAALVVDAFGCHFLTDLFASGHIRVPRRVLGERFGILKGALVMAKRMHDEDNHLGLWCAARVQRAPGRRVVWQAYGDGALSSPEAKPHFARVQEAVRVSVAEVLAAFATDRPTDVGRAEDLIPVPLPAGSTPGQGDVLPSGQPAPRVSPNPHPLYKILADGRVAERVGAVDRDEYLPLEPAVPRRPSLESGYESMARPPPALPPPPPPRVYGAMSFVQPVRSPFPLPAAVEPPEPPLPAADVRVRASLGAMGREAVSPGDTVTFLLSVRADDAVLDPGPAGVTGEVQVSLSAGVRERALVAMVTSPHFARPTGEPWKQSFVVRRDGTTPDAWPFRALADGDRPVYTLSVCFLVDGDPIGGLAIALPRRGDRPVAPAEGALTLPLPGGGRFTVWIANEARTTRLHWFSPGDRAWQPAGEPFDLGFDVDDHLSDLGGTDHQRLDQLRDYCVPFRLALPEPFLDAVDRDAAAQEGIMIMSPATLLPLELLPLGRGRALLGMDRPVLRWIPLRPLPPASALDVRGVGCIRPAFTQGSLPSAIGEEQDLEARFGTLVKAANRAELDALAARTDIDLLHFAGHAQNNPAELLLGDKEAIGPEYFWDRPMMARAPFFFVNGCEAGLGHPSMLPSLGNMMATLLACKFVGAVAPLVTVDSAAARDAAAAFYAAAAQGKTVGEAVQAIHALASAQPDKAGTFLSYVAYAPPALRLRIPTAAAVPSVTSPKP